MHSLSIIGLTETPRVECGLHNIVVEIVSDVPMRIVLTLPTSQFAYSHFAYKCVSFRLHMGIRIYMTYKRFQVQDLL